MGFFERNRRPSSSSAGIDPARLPPGQYLTDRFPVLHVGDVPTYDAEPWDLQVTGLVDRPFAPRPRRSCRRCRRSTLTRRHPLRHEVVEVRHRRGPACAVRDLFERAGVQAEATHVMVHAEYGYTTNLPLDDITRDDSIVAYAFDGEPIEPIHGGPVRLVIPHLYFWKSAKWVRGLELRAGDEPGLLGAQRLPQLRRPLPGAALLGRRADRGPAGGRARRATPPRSASTSASVVDQPVLIRSEWWASTPIASSTGDGSRSSDAQALPEWAAMPAWSRPSSTAWGSMPVDAEADEVGQPVDRVAVDRDALEASARRPRTRSVRRRLLGAFPGQAGGRGLGRGAPADDGRHVLEPGPAGPLLVAADEQRAQPQPRAARAARRRRAGRPSCGRSRVMQVGARGRSKSIGTWPAAWAASTWTSTPRSRHAATTSATGCRVPTSWLPHCTWTSAVSGRDRRRSRRRRRRARGRRSRRP